MSNEDQRFETRDLADESRYVLIDSEGADKTAGREIGEESYVDVVASDGTQRVLYHTGVSEEYGGQGLASVLVRAAVDDTIERGFSVVPVCPYVASWLTKHTEYAAHVVEPGPQHLRAIAEHKG